MPRPKADDKLLAGPYKPPRVRLGDTLFCDRHGEVIVKAFTGKLGWPCAVVYGQPSPILCGELVRAVQNESTTAVAAWWQVSRHLVWKWRKCLGVGYKTPGTFRLRQRSTFTREERARADSTLHSRAYAEKCSRLRKAYWRKRRRAGKLSHGGHRLWTAAEIRQLGKASDSVIGHKIGRTKAAVANKRQSLGIPPAIAGHSKRTKRK